MCIQIAAKKNRPSTSHVNTGVLPVTVTAGPSESDHSGMTSAKFHWSVPEWSDTGEPAVAGTRDLPVIN